MKTPIVSVLMTSFNREDYIASAIESVINSSFKDFELIIVDDASTDGTFSIAKSFEKIDQRIKVYLNESNLGDYPNRNKAASLAKGKYIKYLDSDDIIYSHGLQVMVESMEIYPEAGYGLSSLSDSTKPFPLMISSHDTYLEHFGDFGHFGRAPGSAIILASAFNSVKGFSGKRMIGDYELWFKLSRYYPLVKMPRDLVWDRVHQGQESKSNYAKQYDVLREKIVKDALRHQDCPLSKNEINSILRKYRTNLVRKIIKRWV